MGNIREATYEVQGAQFRFFHAALRTFLQRIFAHLDKKYGTCYLKGAKRLLCASRLSITPNLYQLIVTCLEIMVSPNVKTQNVWK